MTTALRTAMDKAGVDTDRARLRVMAEDYLRLAATLGVDPFAHLAQVKRDMQGKLGEGQKLAADVGRPFAADAEPTQGDGKGQARGADKAIDLLPSPSPPYRERAGHTICADKATVVVPAAREQSAADRRMAITVNTEAARSILDTYRFGDGTALKLVRWDQLRGFVERGAETLAEGYAKDIRTMRDMLVAAKIVKLGVSVKASATVGEIVSAREVEVIVADAQREADRMVREFRKRIKTPEIKRMIAAAMENANAA